MIGQRAGIVGHHQCDVVLSQQGNESGGAEAVVPHLDRVPQPMIRVWASDQLPVGADPLIMAGGHSGRLARRSGEQREERLHPVRIEAQVRWQLPEQRAELGAQREQPAGQEVGQWRLDITQLLQVGDETTALDGEHEVVRRLLRPRGEAGRPLQGIKGAVDLHRVHPLGHVRQLPALRQPLRIEGSAPGSVRPSGDADPGFRGHRTGPSTGSGRELVGPSRGSGRDTAEGSGTLDQPVEHGVQLGVYASAHRDARRYQAICATRGVGVEMVVQNSGTSAGHLRAVEHHRVRLVADQTGTEIGTHAAIVSEATCTSSGSTPAAWPSQV